MTKLRNFFVELICVGLLLGWLMFKYPDAVGDWVPWLALLVVWHMTWEYVLQTKSIRHLAIAYGKRIKPMLAWPLVITIGAAISLLYWKGINASIKQLASTQAAHGHATAPAAENNDHTNAGRAPSQKPPSTETTALVIRFAKDAPYRVVSHSERMFRIGIYNAGDVVADNVAVKLVSITPRPRSALYGAAFPYPMFTLTGNEFVRVNPGEEELFAVARSWFSSDGRIMVAGINKKVPQDTSRDWIAIDKDEAWRLLLRATAANAKPGQIELQMHPGKEAVDVSRIAKPQPDTHKLAPPSVEAVRRKIQDKLADFVGRGTVLRDDWVQRLGKTEDVQRESAQPIQEWHGEVESYLTTIPRGNIYLARFKTARVATGSYPVGINVSMAGWWDTLSSDMERLNEFLSDPDLGKP